MTSANPLFYTKVEPLDAKRHEKLKLKPKIDYSFAREAYAIPITISEFAKASSDYPVIFINDEPLAVAVVGLKAGNNLFITPKGDWQEGVYIPAYVRRYPFVLLEDKEHQRAALCIDTAAARLTKGKAGLALFEGGKPSATSEQALAFCVKFQQAWEASRRALPLLKELDLLRSTQATLRLRSGEKTAVTNFWIIDEARLHALPDEDFLKLRQANLLAAVYSMLLSQSRWNRLIEMAG